LSYSPADLEAIAKKLRYDLTAAQGKLTDLMNGIAELAAKLPSEGNDAKCPRCGVNPPKNTTIDEHLENVHGVRAA
jgi:hypothetical protein